MKTEGRSYILSYEEGAFIVVVASVGFAAVVYGLNLVSFNFFNLPARVFCPLGVYTLVYSLLARKEQVYHVVWGCVMLAVGLVSASYNIVSPLLVLGILLIIIAVIGLIAYKRRKT